MSFHVDCLIYRHENQRFFTLCCPYIILLFLLSNFVPAFVFLSSSSPLPLLRTSGQTSYWNFYIFPVTVANKILLIIIIIIIMSFLKLVIISQLNQNFLCAPMETPFQFSIHPSIHPADHPPLRSFNDPLIQSHSLPSILPFIHQPTSRSVHPSAHSFINLNTHPSVNLPTRPPAYSSIQFRSYFQTLATISTHKLLTSSDCNVNTQTIKWDRTVPSQSFPANSRTCSTFYQSTRSCRILLLTYHRLWILRFRAQWCGISPVT